MVDISSSTTKNTLAEAYKTQRDAIDQAERAQKKAREVEKQEEEHIEDIKAKYSELREKESIRQEDSILKQRAKGYETLLRMKQEQEKDLSNLRRDSERNLQASKSYYDTVLESQTDRGEKDLRETLSTQQQLIAFEKERGMKEILDTRDRNEKEVQSLQTMRDQRVQDLNRSATQTYEQLRANYADANSTIENNFYQQHQKAVEARNLILRSLDEKTAQEVHRIKNDSANKLLAYEIRQEDPFYQIQDLDADLTEYQDEYVLTARVPSHERDSLKVFVKGNQLILSGSRRNEETQNLSPGRTRSTASFQTYNQTFPIHPAVDQRGIQRLFDGDQLFVIIPKISGPFHQRTPASEKPAPEKTRLERPQFPGNLPKIEDPGKDPNATLSTTIEHQIEPELRRPSPKSKGSGTLT